MDILQQPGHDEFLRRLSARHAARGLPMYVKAGTTVGPLAGTPVPNIDPATNNGKPSVGPGFGPPTTFLERISVFIGVRGKTSTPKPNEAACYTRADGVTPIQVSEMPKFAELGLVINANGCIAERALNNALPEGGPFGVENSKFSPLKRLRWNGQDVTVNISYVQWGAARGEPEVDHRQGRLRPLDPQEFAESFQSLWRRADHGRRVL